MVAVEEASFANIDAFVTGATVASWPVAGSGSYALTDAIEQRNPLPGRLLELDSVVVNWRTDGAATEVQLAL